jgi:glycosyltransferase involved in cell wall biosynthesis
LFNARNIGSNELLETASIEYGPEVSRETLPKKRRVLVLSEIIAPYRIPVFNALAKHSGVNLHVVFLAETHAGLRQWRVYKDEIAFSHEVLPSWRFLTGKYDLLLNWGLRSCLNKFAPQTIICGGYNYPASWEALWWKQRHQVELVLWSESNSEDARAGKAWVEWLKTYFIARCERFVVPGKTSGEYLQSLGSAQKDIFVAPNAVDNVWFKTRGEEIRRGAAEFRASRGLPPRFVLFSGRLVPQKGVFDLLEAYAKLESDTRSQIGLVFAGDGFCRTELEQQSKRISPGVVRFPGFAQREDLAGFYALAEALILPTHSDPWGLVVNEAMACGLPIIVSSVAGCSADLVKDGWNGYIVPPGDSEKLSVAINSLVRQPELRERMSARSAEWIQNYSPEACANGLAVAAIGAGKGTQ